MDKLSRENRNCPTIACSRRLQAEATGAERKKVRFGSEPDVLAGPLAAKNGHGNKLLDDLLGAQSSTRPDEGPIAVGETR